MVASKPGETAKAPQMQTKSFEKILIPLYLLVWLALTVSLGLSHEPFADEAQSFLIARDTGIAELLSTTARTEGTPVLWHLWLKLLLFVGLPYSLLFLASVLPEFAAVVLFVCKAPFSAAVRYLFPLTYYVFYQYNVVARSYSLLFLGIVAAALAWKSRQFHPWRCLLALIFLGSVSAHALVLSCSLAVLWLWDECAGRRAVSDNAFPAAGCRFRADFAVFAVFAVFSVWMLWPEPSNQYVRNFAVQPLFILRNVFRLLTTGIVVSASPHPENLVVLYIGIMYFLAACVCLALHFRRYFWAMLFPCISFMCIVPFKPWHAGILIFAVLFVFWQNAEPQKYSRCIKAGIAVFFAVQLVWSAAAFTRDRNGAYSAAPAVYAFMQEQNIAPQDMFLLTFNTVALHPYYNQAGYGAWNWRKDGYSRRITENELLRRRAFVVNGEFYAAYREKLEKIRRRGGFQLKVFPSRHFFALQDKSEDETFYVYYRRMNGRG